MNEQNADDHRSECSFQDAIKRLRGFGYTFDVEGDRIKYSRKEQDELSGDDETEIRTLLGVLKGHKAEVLKDPYFLNVLIQQTLQEVNGVAFPEVFTWLVKNRRNQWGELWGLFNQIERYAKEDIRDVVGLSEALKEYKDFAMRMVDDFNRKHRPKRDV